MILTNESTCSEEKEEEEEKAMHSFVLATIKTSFCWFRLPSFFFSSSSSSEREKMCLMDVGVYIQRGGGGESNRCRAWPLRKRSSYQSVLVCFVDVDVKLKKDQRKAFDQLIHVVC